MSPQGFREVYKDSELLALLQKEVDSLGPLIRQNVSLELSTGYLEIRHRFLDVYRRDVAKHLTTHSRPNIERGNYRARHEDCVTDAELYASGQRTDCERKGQQAASEGARASQFSCI